MKAVDFDERYAREPDPWGYRSSEYEREKYAATLAACGEGPFRSALELGGSIGIFTALLAPRCAQLTSVDFSSEAVTQARRELSGHPHVHVELGEIPDAIPSAQFDLIIASEILYYLEPDALEATVARIEAALAADGRLVLVHWRPAGPERPFTAAEVHARLLAEPWLRPISDASTPSYLLNALRRR